MSYQNTLDSGSTENLLLQKLIDTYKVSAGWDLESNKLAGILHHKLMGSYTPKDIGDYLDKFGNVLNEDVFTFLFHWKDTIDNICSSFKNGPGYEALTSRGILSAKRFFDTYVLKTPDGKWFESPIHMFARLAAFFTCQCLAHSCLKKTLSELQLKIWKNPLETEVHYFVYFFNILSSQLVCCATPVIRSAGLKRGFLASCFIMSPDMSTEENTISALFGNLSPLLMTKSGVGLSVNNFVSENKNILGCLKMINSEVEFFNDNNVRPVSVAAYMELWHDQIEEFLIAKLPENADRCQSIFQGVCIPELFFETYTRDPNEKWYLFSFKNAPRLAGLYGEEFKKEYYKLIEEKKYTSFITAKSLMFTLINTIIKTGSPYILLKESINKHHWFETQGNAIGYANLCAEVIQHPQTYTSTCNLANICLPRCLVDMKKRDMLTCGISISDSELCGTEKIFCMKTLQMAVQACVFMINAAILGGSSPTENVAIMQSERSMGIGVQGLADVFAYMGKDYMDPVSADLDCAIFEHMYFWAVTISNQIVSVGGGIPFNGWKRSKLSLGKFHWESWGVDENTLSLSKADWEKLRKEVVSHGTFNSQFLALMPTAGTSQITGYSESFYPFYANVSSKVSNKEEIMKPNITFLEHVRPSDIPILRFHGGDVTKLPKHLAKRYKNFLTAFDYSPEDQIKRSHKRGAFIDQSQSFSLFLKENNVKSASYLKNLLLLGYKLGLKTIMYYCRIQKQTSLSALECLKYTKSEDDITEDSASCEYKDASYSTRTERTEKLNTCLACQ
ncbi:ribonucleotide reductase subunit 1 [Vespertilionid gammaherpesvirus 1]|uniref:Ribonucleoside-diphosphate reductase large subunit n=1 Tax=Vespertilionid gammaherpesvirus 1 TaxID=2560830 RepID=A0A0X9YML6_9GAMA|nr:ribonucleotide reductase subunit 1 [Myotis gammaherpesvirus 8]AMA67418.1 ribonucleotide reductase subunit 1 [Vespertilionid gammaherpesvirus 1]